MINMWWFPKIGVPPNHPFIDAAIGVSPFKEPPICISHGIHDNAYRGYKRFTMHEMNIPSGNDPKLTSKRKGVVIFRQAKNILKHLQTHFEGFPC